MRFRRSRYYGGYGDVRFELSGYVKQAIRMLPELQRKNQELVQTINKFSSLIAQGEREGRFKISPEMNKAEERMWDDLTELSRSIDVVEKVYKNVK